MLFCTFVTINFKNLIIAYHLYFLFIFAYLLIINYGFSYGYNYIFTVICFFNFYWCIYINIFFIKIYFYNYMYICFYNNVIFLVYNHLKCNFLLTDIRNVFGDFLFYFTGLVNFFSNSNSFFLKLVTYIKQFNDRRKYILKKYVYTINHKRIAINYFIFSVWTALSGAALATMIRLELAYPGSPFFKGDSTRYLQTITAHGLIMIFFVVVPILFGGFANFLIPYHVGSKDVAYPRLNSIGF